MKILKLLIITFLIIITSCNKKSVKLPVLKISGIQDTIYDNTQVWMFYELENGDTIVELNRNNTISSTNWIFNIDKRLPLHQVIPHLKKLIEKREKPAMHPKDIEDTNFFSYVDSDSNTLSMVQFDVINYITDKTIVKTNLVNDSLTKHIFIDYQKNALIVNDSMIVINQLENYLNMQPDNIKLNLHLSFDKYLSYHNYLHLKAILQNNENKYIIIDKHEFIK